MAFPTIPTVAGGRVLTANIDGTGTRTFPNLSGLTKNAGDLLIAIIVAHQSSSGAGAPGGSVFSAWGGGFTEFCDQMTTNSSTMAIGAAYKISDGTETGTFTVTQAATITGGASLILLSIPGAHATTPPEAGTVANGTSAAANPGSFNPASWGTEDTLWISVVCSGMTASGGTWTATGTAAPTNYSDRVDTNRADDSTVGRVEGAVSFRQLNAASEDVGTAGVDTSNARNSALVIAVRPAPSDFPLDVQPGSFSIGGLNAPVVAGRVANAQPVSYAVSGQIASVVASRSVIAAPGPYAVAGALATFSAPIFITADPGAFAVTGSPAGLIGDRMVTAVPGVYSVSGAIAGLLAGRSLNAFPGSHAITSAIAGLVADRSLLAASGAYSLSALAATLSLERAILAGPGSFAVSGVAGAVLADRVLSGAPGAYLVDGIAALLLAGRVVVAAPGVYVITGIDATLLLEGGGPGQEFMLDAQPGAFTILGLLASPVSGRLLTAEAATVVLSGDAAGFLASRILNATLGSYLLAGFAIPGAGDLVFLTSGFDHGTPLGVAGGAPGSSRFDASEPIGQVD